MTEFVPLRPKTYFYLMDDDTEKKKVKGTKKNVVKLILKFVNYKYWLLNKKTILKSHQKFKSENISIWKNAFNVSKSEILSSYKWLNLMIIQMKTKQNII